MALKTQLKAGAIGNLTDARYFAAAGADWIGFCFDPTSPDYIEVEKAAQIKEWVAGPQFIGEFKNQDVDNMQAICNRLELSMIQIGVSDLFNLPQSLKMPVMLQLDAEKADALLQQISDGQSHSQRSRFHEWVSDILLDARSCAPQNITEVVRKLAAVKPVILSCEFTTSELNDLLERNQLTGIEIRGGTEQAVGIKSFDNLDDLMDLLEVE